MMKLLGKWYNSRQLQSNKALKKRQASNKSKVLYNNEKTPCESPYPSPFFPPYFSTQKKVEGGGGGDEKVF